ncbi:MAG: hypothetical protein M1824_004703 [Vezdaea acicularis]|nr:MAG: hypothetical protein M1824_004703 [Vezdaea acicularis]
MEPLSLKPRQPVDDVECWDDDEDFAGGNLEFRTASTATSVSGRGTRHRESVSSRMSARSDFDSIDGDEETQLVIPRDDEESTSAAINSAINAGIPIPKNVPPSALVGGTIKRLGGKRSKKVIGDDWGEDLELPEPNAGTLSIRKHNGPAFPDAIRGASGQMSQPQSPAKGLSFAERIGMRTISHANSTLNQFRDDDNDDFFGDGTEVPTIKVTKRSPRKAIPFHIPQGHSQADAAVEDFEKDLELPQNGEPLSLSARKETLKSPTMGQDEFDEWTEGSLGTRHGGTHRGKSNRSSSFSAMSPSVSSTFTAESEDDVMEGLHLPDGPLNFKDILARRQRNESPDPANHSVERQSTKQAGVKEDFFSGIEIGDGDVFDSGKLTLNRNIKHTTGRPISPARRTAVTLTFTNKNSATDTRLPRPRSGNDRTHGSKLESVSESNDPVSKVPRPQSRAARNSWGRSGIPAPSTPSSRNAVSTTPNRQKAIVTRPSMKALRGEPTTTSAQLLKAKRSLPALRGTEKSPAKTYTSSQRPPSRGDGPLRNNISQRPPSRGDGAHRNIVVSRPKTPTDRPRAESSLAKERRPPVPFLPAGIAQSHHITTKTRSNFRRHDSESSAASNEHRPISRTALSRTGLRSPSPMKRREMAPAALAREAASKRTLTRPNRTRNFGNGTELEIFDDLPTSLNAESKFVKQPVGRGPPKVMRNKATSNQLHPDRTVTPAPAPATTPTPISPLKTEYTPRFARDTNASRIAREQRTGAATPALASSITNWKTQSGGRHGAVTSPTASRGKRRPEPRRKPLLIKPLGNTHQNAKTEKGMHYNPALYRWEGNENALAPFDAPINNGNGLSNSPMHGPTSTTKSGMQSGPRQMPGLLRHLGNNAIGGVQREGNMFFDPTQLKWLKLAPHERQQSRASNVSNPLSLTSATDDDSDDPFAGMDDLDDAPKSKGSRPGTAGSAEPSTKKEASHDDDWLVGEEFDVGPEFIRRQREEEERWRRKTEMWITGGERELHEGSKWGGIRGLISGRQG